MRKSTIKALALGLGLTLSIAACATKQDPTQQAPGFLPDYSLLKPIDSPEGTQIYMYKNPNAKRSDYNAAIVDPVSIYQKAGESGSTVTEAQIEKARLNIQNGIKEIINKKLDIVNKPGKGVLRLNVAITGATLDKESFKPWNIVPVSAALYLAKKATDLDSKKPVMVVELKFTDSQSGTLLKEVVTTISGDTFRMSSNTPAEFETLANEWVKQAIQYSNKN